MSEVRLQIKNLCKSFGITKAVQNVSFDINKGEVHALIGENGSGKSTLTNMLTGIYTEDSGTFILYEFISKLLSIISKLEITFLLFLTMS